MSFVTKLIENKQTIALLLGSVTVGALQLRFNIDYTNFLSKRCLNRRKLNKYLNLRDKLIVFTHQKQIYRNFWHFVLELQKKK